MTLLETSAADMARMLPARNRDCQKGDFGRGLLIAGSERYAGAALMSAAAALRAGVGVLYVCVPKGIRQAFFTLPEAVCIGVGNGPGWDAEALCQAAAEIGGKSAYALGSGMGSMEDDGLMSAVLGTKRPTVIDADGLNFLSRNPGLISALHENVVLTPHALEFSRLSGLPLEEIKKDPAECALQAAGKWHCVVLLKGAQSFISDGTRVFVNRTGNAGLAKGGSGDVLTGLILALLCQGLSPLDAARAGAFLLGASADEALPLLQCRMLMARDVVGMVGETIKGLQTRENTGLPEM